MWLMEHLQCVTVIAILVHFSHTLQALYISNVTENLPNKQYLHCSLFLPQRSGPPLKSLGQGPLPAIASLSLGWMTTVLCYLGDMNLTTDTAIMCTSWI